MRPFSNIYGPCDELYLYQMPFMFIPRAWHSSLEQCWSVSWCLAVFCFADISTGRVKAHCFPAQSKLEDSWTNSPLKPAGTSSAWAGSRWGHRSAPSLPSCPSVSPPLKVAIKKTRRASSAPRPHRGLFYKQMNRAGGGYRGPQTVRRASRISTL